MTMSLFDDVTDWKVRLFAVLSACLLVIMTGGMIATRFERSDLLRQVKGLRTQIYNPDDGYVARLTQLQSNLLACRDGMIRQNESIQAMSDQDEDRIKAIRAQYDSERASWETAVRQTVPFLDPTISGHKWQDQVLTVDRMILADLKK